MEMVFWTSSEVPEVGMGLIDYQTNPAVDRWLKEKVLLEPSATKCTVPKGIFGEGGGAMLRMIAYGSELNLAHPPRPTDPKSLGAAVGGQAAGEERVQCDAGMDMGEMQRGSRRQAQPQAQDAAPPAAEQKQEEKMPDPVNILRGILGR